MRRALKFLPYTGPGNDTCTWLQECCRQVEAEVVSNIKNILHQNSCACIIFRPSWLSACWIQFETIRNGPMVVAKSDRDCIAGSLIGRTDEIGRKSWQITEPLLFSEQQELLCSLCEVRNTATTGHDVSVQCAKLKTSSANAAAGLRVLQISLECGAAVESLSRPLGRSTTDQKVTAFFNRSKIALGRFAVQAVHL